MKDLKKINYKLNLLIVALIIFLHSQNIQSLENRIIFKINDNAFTSFDLEKRIEYLDFVGSNQNIDRCICDQNNCLNNLSILFGSLLVLT